MNKVSTIGLDLAKSVFKRMARTEPVLLFFVNDRGEPVFYSSWRCSPNVRRPGNDLTYRFTLIVEALGRLRSRSCIIDGEAVSSVWLQHHRNPRCLGLRIWCDL